MELQNFNTFVKLFQQRSQFISALSFIDWRQIKQYSAVNSAADITMCFFFLKYVEEIFSCY